MIPDNAREIIQGLIDKSKRREVNWYPSNYFNISGSDEDDFAFGTSDYTVNIFKVEQKISFIIFNTRARQVMNIDALPAQEQDYALLEELFNLAKSKVEGIDDILLDLKRSINSPKQIGTIPAKDENIPF